MSFDAKEEVIMPLAESGSTGLHALGWLLTVASALLVFYLAVSYYSSPLRSIPGPFLAKFTDAWRVMDYWKHTQIHSHRELHRRLGPAVRIGPNMVSLSDPSLLKKIYDTRGNFLKVYTHIYNTPPMTR